MQEKIAEILEGLKDEAHIQPIIYALFEKSDPEEVKKTIDDLQRSLSLKSEEVKKNLSANHEHLFSCTDMVEQLRAFSMVSSSHVSKISALSQKLLTECTEEESEFQQSLAEQKSVLNYQVTPAVYTNTVLSYVQSGAEQNPWLAAKCYLLALNNPAFHGSADALKSTWVKLVSGCFKQMKLWLEGRFTLHAQAVSSLYNLLLPSFQVSTPNYVQLPRSQVFLICSRIFGVHAVDAHMTKIKNTSEFLHKLLSKIGESVKFAPKTVDPLQFVGLLSLLENLELLSMSPLSANSAEASDKLLKRVCDDIFNHGIGLERDLQKLSRKVDSCFEELEVDRSEQHNFLSIYSHFVAHMVDGLELVANSQFDFAFVRRFYQRRAEVEQVEELHGVAPAHRMGSVIRARWADYCSQIVRSLESRVDFLNLCESMPDEFRSKDALRIGMKDNRRQKAQSEKIPASQLTSVEFLKSIQQELDDCLKTLCKLANVTEANDSSVIEGIQFEIEAKQKFADLIKHKTHELVESIAELRVAGDYSQIFKYLLVAHVILSSNGVVETVAAKDFEVLKLAWSAQAKEAVSSTSLEDFCTKLEAFFRRFKLTWADEIANSFLSNISPALTQSHPDHPSLSIFSTTPWSLPPQPQTPNPNFPQTLPSLVRQHLPHPHPTSSSPPPPRPLPPTPAPFDGFTHLELLQQLLP